MRLAIVGAGIIGLSVAAQAARSGARVQVLESQDRPGGVATAASFAWVNARERSHEGYRRLRAKAVDRHHELAPLGAFHPVGPATPHARDREGWLDVEAWSQHCLQTLADDGGELLLGRTVQAVQPPGRHARAVTVATDHEQLEVDHVVLATGAAAATLAPGLGRIGTGVGDLGFLALIEPGQDLPDGADLPWGLGEHLNLRPAPSGGVAVQSLRVERERLQRWPTPRPDLIVDDLRTLLAQTLSDSAWRRATMTVRVAARPESSDGLPVIGRRDEHTTVVLTHSGVTLAPLLGDWICRELAGERLPGLAPFRL